MMNKTNSKIVNINKIDKSNSCAIIPGYSNRKKRKKLKELSKSRGNCYFTSGIPHNLINFIYRAVVQLGLKNKKVLFSRGAVKINNLSVLNAVAIRELDWDVGISIRIPHRLNYNTTTKMNIKGEEYSLKNMELIVLSALLSMAYPHKTSKWYSDMSVIIIAKGWNHFKNILKEKELTNSK